MLSTHYVGKITELAVAQAFLQRGYQVNQPLVADSRYDFIVDVKGNVVYRHQGLYEVDVNVDSDVIFRGFRKKKRELSYFFQEHKVIILGIILILLVFLGFNIYTYLSVAFKVYNQNDIVGNEYFVKVNTVVLTNIDFSDAFESAVEEKMIAEQAKLKAEYENQTKIDQAEAEAAANAGPPNGPPRTRTSWSSVAPHSVNNQSAA